MNTKTDQDVLAEMENDLRKTVHGGAQWSPQEIERAKASGVGAIRASDLGGTRPRVGSAGKDAKIVTAAQVEKALHMLLGEITRTSVAYSTLLARLDGGEVYEVKDVVRPAGMPMFTDFADLLGHIATMNNRVAALNTRFAAVLSGEEL